MSPPETTPITPHTLRRYRWRTTTHALSRRACWPRPLQQRSVPSIWLSSGSNRLGTHAGDTGTEEGVDHVPYFFAHETQLALQLHGSATQVQQVVLKHFSGGEVARSTGERGGTVVTVPPGAYLLEVHHARKGQAGAPAQRLFVRPGVLTAGVAARTGVVSRQEARAVVTLTASQDCQNCDFSKTSLKGHDFSGVNLSGAKFLRADLTGANFTDAVMIGCNLSSMFPESDGNLFLGDYQAGEYRFYPGEPHRRHLRWGVGRQHHLHGRQARPHLLGPWSVADMLYRAGTSLHPLCGLSHHHTAREFSQRLPAKQYAEQSRFRRERFSRRHDCRDGL